MAKTSKFYKQQKYVSFDGGDTWSPLNEYQKGRWIENDSPDCGGGSSMTYYKWEVIDGEYTCYIGNKYYMERQYVSNDNINWTPTLETRQGALYQANSSECGYRERWVTLGISSYWICENGNKYYKEMKQVSIDNGASWSQTTEYRKGELYQEGSSDCTQGEPIYEWRTIDINTDYECNGVDKHYKEQKYESYDNGTTWNATNDYRRGALYQANSTDCGYVPTSFKLQATYSDSTTYNLQCGDSSTLIQAEVRGGQSPASAMTSAIIGDCVNFINNNAFSNLTALTSVTIPSSVSAISYTSFAWCSNLASVTIPSSVKTIDSSAFYVCSSLSSVTLNEGLEIIGNSAFAWCSSLTSVTVPSTVTSIGGQAFGICSGLTSLTILATTPPTVESNVLQSSDNAVLYVPSQSVNAYKTAEGWSEYADRIFAIPS